MFGQIKEAARKVGSAPMGAMKPTSGMKPLPRPVNTEMRNRIAMKAKAMMGNEKKA